jgi:hypothetical protein
MEVIDVLVQTQKMVLGEAAFRPGMYIAMETAFPYALEGGAAIAFVALALQCSFVFFFVRQSRRNGGEKKAFTDSHDRLALIESMDSFGFWCWDAATDQVWASTHTRTILGIDEDAPLVREALLAVIHPAHRANVLQTISQSARPSDTMEMEPREIGQGGEIRWITSSRPRKMNWGRDSRYPTRSSLPTRGGCGQRTGRTAEPHFTSHYR